MTETDQASSEPSLFELVCRQLGEGELPSMESIEKWYVLEVLRRLRGNRTHAARALGIGANTLWRKLKRWGVPPARTDDASGGSPATAGGRGLERCKDDAQNVAVATEHTAGEVRHGAAL